ncbi:hypothetical protein PV328_007734 [Microctonus aethiopoides]|uniref:SWIM-type domain-containing protein n=1 Tax=Microctonus aethiopoides TaxID=144406 RepID=A0AA39F0T6_9HYME|nr:hypothetical protein PV328_007734 [Microctonus aethiopoides]
MFESVSLGESGRQPTTGKRRPPPIDSATIGGSSNPPVLETGFKKVLHSIEFQPQTVQKGKLLNETNDVINVKEFGINGTRCRIEARVIRQTSVNSTPYTTNLILDSSRNVTSVSCTCVYNKSGKCKHITAVIYYINNEQSLSKTNFGQQ